MYDLLINNPKFEPLDILESQLNRSSVQQMIDWKRDVHIVTLHV